MISGHLERFVASQQQSDRLGLLVAQEAELTDPSLFPLQSGIAHSPVEALGARLKHGFLLVLARHNLNLEYRNEETARP